MSHNLFNTLQEFKMASRKGAIDYSQVVELDLASVTPSLAGPKRPQDRIEIGKVKSKFTELFSKSAAEKKGARRRPC